ncbi:MAG: RNase P modulator RnpM [Bacillota bacterium]
MRVRRVPQRTCVGCLEVKGKKELVRVVRTPEGIVEVDPTGKRAGRGAYLCPDTSCLEKAVKGKRLEKALGVEIGGDVLERVRLRLGDPQSGRR